MDALGIDPKLLIAQMVNFLIFYIIFRKFIAKPLIAYIKKQQEEEQKRHSLSQELDRAKSELDSEKKQMLVEVKEQQKKILEDAKVYAENIKKEMIVQAQKQASEIVDAGKIMLDQEKHQAQSELKKYVRETAQIAIEKGLSSYLTGDVQKNITKHIIDTL